MKGPTSDAQLSFGSIVQVVTIDHTSSTAIKGDFGPCRTCLTLGRCPLAHGICVLLGSPGDNLPDNLASFLASFQKRHVVLGSKLMPTATTIEVMSMGRRWWVGGGRRP